MRAADPPEPQPRVAPAHRAARRPDEPAVRARWGEPAARHEPVVAISPPRWFAATCVAAAVVVAVLAAVATAAGVSSGDPVSTLASLVGGVGLTVMAYDASRRSVRTDGDILTIEQWFRTTTLRRAEVEEFAAARASFVRWDVVAVPLEGPQVRLWVTRMLPAGRSKRQAWLTELEAWRTWVGPSAPS